MVDLLVDPNALRDQVTEKYRELGVEPHRTFHFHVGRVNAARLGYGTAAVDARPELRLPRSQAMSHDVQPSHAGLSWRR